MAVAFGWTSFNRASPQQNAYVERCNRTVRYDWLAQSLFDSITPVAIGRPPAKSSISRVDPVHLAQDVAIIGVLASTSRLHATPRLHPRAWRP